MKPEKAFKGLGVTAFSRGRLGCSKTMGCVHGRLTFDVKGACLRRFSLATDQRISAASARAGSQQAIRVALQPPCVNSVEIGAKPKAWYARNA